MNKLVLFYDELIILPQTFLNCFESYSFVGSELSNSILKEKKCDILLSRSTIKVNNILLAGVKLKYYATATAGFDHIDTNYLINNKINYFIASGSNSNSVAEYVMINILNWLKQRDFNPTDKTIGIIGFGNIGKKVATYSNFLGLNIIINDLPLINQNYNFPEYVKHYDLDYILKNSDIITNHLPLINSGIYKTNNLFSENLKLLKNNILFIHSSRGEIVNENAILNLKKNNNINLIIDVWENEPNIQSELLKFADIATPHIAGHSYDAKINASNMILKNMYDYKIVNELYKIENNIKETVDNRNIFNKIEIATKKRELECDSNQLKNHIKDFKKLRNQYPKRLETLSI
jgi:erythronate-4-phosphate dehydrogenase